MKKEYNKHLIEITNAANEKNKESCMKELEDSKWFKEVEKTLETEANNGFFSCIIVPPKKILDKNNINYIIQCLTKYFEGVWFETEKVYPTTNDIKKTSYSIKAIWLS